MKIQLYAHDTGGRLTHCGAYEGEFSAPAVEMRHREWEAWREQYLAQNPGDYPLRAVKRATMIVAHPVGAPDETIVLRRTGRRWHHDTLDQRGVREALAP